MEVSPQRPQPQFFCLPLSLSLTHTFTLHKQKTARVCPTGLGKGSRRSHFLGQTAPRHYGWAQCHSTSHRVSMKWQSRQDSPPPPPPTCSRSCSYSNSLLVQQAWDAEYELGWKGEQGPAGWQWMGQEAKETGRLTRWPKFLSCLIRDILDLFLLPATDLKCQRSLSGLKVTPSACPHWPTYISECKSNTGSPGSQEQQEKMTPKKTMLSCTLKHNCTFANSPTSLQNKSQTTNKGLIPSRPSPLSPMTQRAVRRAERPSNTPTEKADMDQ